MTAVWPAWLMVIAGVAAGWAVLRWFGDAEEREP